MPAAPLGKTAKKPQKYTAMNTEIYITKRDGKREAFSIDKIKSAVAKAFLSVGSFATQETMTGVLSRLNISNGMTVEEIQNQVEVALMAEQYFSVAKSFMIYRQKRFEDREVRDKLRFLIDYCNATNPATGSKYDANANVENKNIATLIGELPKSNFIRLNRKLLTDKIKQMYGKEVSDKYLDLLNRHFIYKNDETSLANYCASITMYPWLLSGTLSIGGNSTRPTNLKSFCGGFVNITQNTKNVVFCGTFTTGKLREEIKDGELHILQEGKVKKFVPEVGHITFSGNYARKHKQHVLYITERAVFEMKEDGVHLTEIAPGIDLQKDVLDQMGFTPIIDEVKVMPAFLFEDKPMGLKKMKEEMNK